MNAWKNALVVLLLGAIPLVQSCREYGCVENPKPFWFIDPRLYHYIFGEGSYRVYVEQNTLQIDSQFVTRVVRESNLGYSDECEGQFQHEYKIVYCESHINGSIDSFHYDLCSEPMIRSFQCVEQHTNPLPQDSFFHYYIIDSREELVGQDIDFLFHFDSVILNYQIGAFVYPKVYKFTSNKLGSYSNAPASKQYYYAYDVGLVRRIENYATDTLIWNLVAYQNFGL